MSAAFREHLRVPISFVATITRKNGQILTGEINSASLGGAFICCDHGTMEQDESCEVSIILSDGQMSIDGLARVSYVKPDGVGIRFEGVDPSSFEHLIKLMMFHVKKPEAIRAEVKKSRKIAS